MEDESDTLCRDAVGFGLTWIQIRFTAKVQSLSICRDAPSLHVSADGKLQKLQLQLGPYSSADIMHVKDSLLACIEKTVGAQAAIAGAVAPSGSSDGAALLHKTLVKGFWLAAGCSSLSCQ